MIRFYDRTTLQTTLRMRVSMRALGTALVGSSLLFAAVASAATIDFNTAVGNYDSALDPDAGRALEHYLRHGTLATRITAALPEEPARAELERVYRDLCQCLAMNEPYAAPARR